MKNLFRLSLVAFASLLFGCMSEGPGDEPLTIVLPDLSKGISSFTYVNQPVPTGSVNVISSVQFIRDTGSDTSGVLVVASNEELSELYLYVKGSTSGYYVLSISDNDIKTSDSKDSKYVYSVLVENWPYEEDLTEVSGKTDYKDQISSGATTKYESMDRGLTCGMSASGGEAGWIGNIDMGQRGGTFELSYDTYTIPDRIAVYDGINTKTGNIYKWSGGSDGMKYADIRFSQSVITVEVTGLGPGTSWKFTVDCPN